MNKLFTVVLVAAFSGFAQNSTIKSVSLSATATAIGVHVKPQTPSLSVKSFKEWKNEGIQAAIKRITITKAQIEYRKLNKQFLQINQPVGKDLEIERLESALRQDQFSLELAQDSGIPEYFIYLTKLGSDSYEQAAEKMTSEEVSQLIKAYADSMFSSNGSGSSKTKVGPTAMDKSDLIK